MVRAHRPSPELALHLATLYDRFPFQRSFEDDPIAQIRPYSTDRRHAEVTALYGATLAIGNTTAIRGSIRRLVELAGGDLVAAVRDGGAPGPWREFRHRWIRGDQMTHLARRLHATYASYDSLEDVFLEGMEADGFARGIDSLARALRGPSSDPKAPRGYRALFPSPLDPHRSPAKRLTLYLRWMVRDRFPDFGFWNRIPMNELRVPLDQHVFWIAYHLGLTHRRTRSWATVEEVTAALRRIDPVDPIRFDFVLCHTGISGDCPKRRDIAVCGPCAVRPDCLMWRSVRGAS
ncbi:MAG: DUF2400 family protein [Thermoplasmata archaeon]